MILLESGSWAEFKDICITKKNLNCQYVLRDGRYDLYGPDANGLTWHTSILQENPRSSDQVDLEDNHLVNFNWPIGQRPYPFSTSDFEFSGNGIIGLCTAGASLVLDLQIDPVQYPVGQDINGGLIVIKGGEHGDWLECSVVDAGNLLPTPYTGATLKTWIKKWYLPELGVTQIQTPYAGRIPPGMYLRATYHSTGISNVKVAINYFLHTPI